MYRMVTQLAPYASHPELPQFHGQIEECADELAALGARARELDIRLSTHPGQYTVLNSEREEVVDAAIAELEVQGALFEAMGLGPEATIVIHVGGSAGGEAEALDRFERGSERLSERVRRHLRIENDDRRSASAPSRSWAGDAASRSSGTSSTTAATTPTGSPTPKRCAWRWPRGPRASRRRSITPPRAWTSVSASARSAGASSARRTCPSSARTPT